MSNFGEIDVEKEVFFPDSVWFVVIVVVVAVIVVVAVVVVVVAVIRFSGGRSVQPSTDFFPNLKATKMFQDI